jgi:hypothetical protein
MQGPSLAAAKAGNRMTKRPSSDPQSLAQYGVLALAVLVAVGVGSYFYLANSDSDGASPARPSGLSALPGAEVSE